jgi:hypothetical protein
MNFSNKFDPRRESKFRGHRSAAVVKQNGDVIVDVRILANKTGGAVTESQPCSDYKESSEQKSFESASSLSSSSSSSSSLRHPLSHSKRSDGQSITSFDQDIKEDQTIIASPTSMSLWVPKGYKCACTDRQCASLSVHIDREIELEGKHRPISLLPPYQIRSFASAASNKDNGMPSKIILRDTDLSTCSIAASQNAALPSSLSLKKERARKRRREKRTRRRLARLGSLTKSLATASVASRDHTPQKSPEKPIQVSAPELDEDEEKRSMLSSIVKPPAPCLDHSALGALPPLPKRPRRPPLPQRRNVSMQWDDVFVAPFSPVYNPTSPIPVLKSSLKQCRSVRPKIPKSSASDRSVLSHRPLFQWEDASTTATKPNVVTQTTTNCRETERKVEDGTGQCERDLVLSDIRTYKENFPLKKHEFVFFNLWDVAILRDNSLVYDEEIHFALNGLSSRFKWNDIMGIDSNFELVAIKGTPYAIYRPRTGTAYRYLADGLTPKERGQIFSTLSYRRDDKKPMDNILIYRIFSSAIKQIAWQHVLYERNAIHAVSDLTDVFKTYDFDYSCKLHEAARYSPPESWWQWIKRHVMVLLSYFMMVGACITGFAGFSATAATKTYSVIASYSKLGCGSRMVDVKPGSTVLFGVQKFSGKHTIKALASYIPVNINFPSSTLGNLFRSVTGRQMKYISHAEPKTMKKLHRYAKAHIEKYIKPSVHTIPSYKQWLESRNWSLAKKDKYDMEFDGFCFWSSRRSTFMKREIVLGGGDKPARTINASDTDIQCTAGPLMSALKSYFCKFSLDMPVTMACGLSRNDIGGLLARLTEPTHGKFRKLGPGGISFCSGDFSRFDSTICGPLMELERFLYKAIFPTTLAHEVIDNFITRCQKDFKAYSFSKYFNFGAFIRTSRGSGDPNTTLGNTIINYFMWSYLLDNIDGGRFLPLIQVFVCGDDVLLVGATSDLENFKERIRQCNFFDLLGTKLEFEPIVGNHAEAEFLSGWYLRGDVGDKRHYVHAAKLGRVLAKTPLTHKMWHNDTEFYTLKYSKILAMATELWYLPKFSAKLRQYCGSIKKPGVHASQQYYTYSTLPVVNQYTRLDFKTRYWLKLDDVDDALCRDFDCVNPRKLTGRYYASIIRTDLDTEIITAADEDKMVINSNEDDITAIDEHVHKEVELATQRTIQRMQKIDEERKKDA